MNETTKARQHWGPLEKSVLTGKGIDIGCGPDPVTPDARPFDVQHGDANVASQFVKDQFDFVYSSHCLEHMHEPRKTILDWWKMVRPGGHLFILVPEEDLYEQGVFPSRFNSDHKATFTVSKRRSWSPVSHNVLDLARSLPNGELVSLELQDAGYNRGLMSFGQNKPTLLVRAFIKFHRLVHRLTGKPSAFDIREMVSSFYPVDQTNTTNAQAQIQLIVRKRPDAPVETFA